MGTWPVAVTQGLAIGMSCSSVTVLKFLLILYLNLCFKREVQWDNEAYSRESEIQPMHGPTSSQHPRMGFWPPSLL